MTSVLQMFLSRHDGLNLVQPLVNFLFLYVFILDLPRELTRHGKELAQSSFIAQLEWVDLEL